MGSLPTNNENVAGDYLTFQNLFEKSKQSFPFQIYHEEEGAART
jgi:hypothetical protein